MLEQVKKLLGITGKFQDETINGWIDEIKQLMIDGGISPSIVKCVGHDTYLTSESLVAGSYRQA